MMRKIEELLEFKINNEIHHEVECQILFDNRKAKVEEESLLDEYDDDVDTVSWENLESSCWDLMKSKGINWKLFVIWIESLIYIHGWDEGVYCFKSLYAVLKSKSDLLFSQEDPSGCIEFFDKSIARALVLQPIHEEDSLFQFLTYKKTNPQKLSEVLSVMEKSLYEEFLEVYRACMPIFSSLTKLHKNFSIHFVKIFDVFSQLHDVLNLYAKNFLEESEELDEAGDGVSETDSAVSSSENVPNKESVYASLAESLDVLKEIDHQNIAIPLLRKIMRWKNCSISEIFNEINDKEGAYFLLKFLMD